MILEVGEIVVAKVVAVTVVVIVVVVLVEEIGVVAVVGAATSADMLTLTCRGEVGRM